MDKRKLKVEIMKVFESSYRPLYLSDLKEKFKLELKTISEACDELVSEGMIVM